MNDNRKKKRKDVTQPIYGLEKIPDSVLLKKSQEELGKYKSYCEELEDRIKELEKERMNNHVEYILCAAVRRIEERNCHRTYYEPFHDIYKIELGWRHPDIIHRFGGEVSRKPNDQGFYTSKGRFVTRPEALKIARAAGQVDKIIGGVLTSEDLY